MDDGDINRQCFVCGYMEDNSPFCHKMCEKRQLFIDKYQKKNYDWVSWLVGYYAHLGMCIDCELGFV
jgi:hypothetical protein